MNERPRIRRSPTYALTRIWGQEIIVVETPHYLGKVLLMRARMKGGLQYHVEKDEAFYLWSGRALVRCDDGDGRLLAVEMNEGETYHIPPGAVHQVEALEDCIFFEVSTPHHDDRVRCETQYGLPEDGGLPTTRPAA